MASTTTHPLAKSLEIHSQTTQRRKKRISVSIDFNSSKCLNEGVDIEDSGLAVCSCQQSGSFPICDGTHEVFNRETKSNMKPVIVKLKSSTKITSSTQTEPDSFTTEYSTLTPSISPLKSKDELVIQTNEEENEDENESISTQTEAPKKREIVEVNRKLILDEWTLEEIAKHDSEDDCWIIVNNCVYDITAYFSFHPGGKRALIKFAGKDATENVQFHSSKMLMLLNKYFFVGRVAGTTKRWASCSIS